MTDIIQFTTVHARTDPRIRYKQATTLAELYPGRVALYVQDGLGDETDPSGLRVVDTGPICKSRIKRILSGSWRMYRAVLSSKPKVAHFHDPELIVAGLFLQVSGIKVIYDIHEDVPKQILCKIYVKPAWLRPLLARCVAALERFAVGRFSMATPAVQSIADRFPKDKTCVIRNVPKLELLTAHIGNEKPTDRFIVNYAGSLTLARGIGDLVAAMDLLPDGFELHLLGSWQPQSILEECQNHPGWRRCTYFGHLPHSEVGAYLQQAHLGTQMVHDMANYRGGLATKVFEYLALGIPTLMSDTVERRATYGSLTEYAIPADPQAIADAILKIRDNYPLYVERVVNQRDHILETYSWSSEAIRLENLYNRLLR